MGVISAWEGGTIDMLNFTFFMQSLHDLIYIEILEGSV